MWPGGGSLPIALNRLDDGLDPSALQCGPDEILFPFQVACLLPVLKGATAARSEVPYRLVETRSDEGFSI